MYGMKLTAACVVHDLCGEIMRRAAVWLEEDERMFQCPMLNRRHKGGFART